MDVMGREWAVIQIRMGTLADAIRSRDWQQVEFQYDRVQSAMSKADGTRER